MGRQQEGVDLRGQSVVGFSPSILCFGEETGNKEELEAEGWGALTSVFTIAK